MSTDPEHIGDVVARAVGRLADDDPGHPQLCGAWRAAASTLVGVLAAHETTCETCRPVPAAPPADEQVAASRDAAVALVSLALDPEHGDVDEQLHGELMTDLFAAGAPAAVASLVDLVVRSVDALLLAQGAVDEAGRSQTWEQILRNTAHLYRDEERP
ncbi:hypothetical protein [Cryptosporangium arvum]|uniref:Uncharacterized protein n=1 Tax=Cryptosporangium arvum DSM 44712 TaxID=927661 RepID=A0A010ZMV7_9ACTN|nr:hypothetical protein [Cryptosporangium arvum]EXG80019.1 hypothetical protein CryarDRAFT_1078 [Cryptosporangium arvum DSM 44712]